MATLHPQEIFLLERYSSLEYLMQVRDAWKAFVRFTEDCLEKHMQHLPPNQRRKPLPDQADIVWGGTVLPNFRAILDGLNQSVILRSHDDPDVFIGLCGSLMSANKGESEFSHNWMNEVEQEQYYGLMSQALRLAQMAGGTAERTWDEGDLLGGYSEEYFGALALPPRLPAYELDETAVVGPRDPVTTTGIYLPDVPATAAQLLYPRSPRDHAGSEGVLEALQGRVKDEDGEWRSSEWVPATWTLVRRIEGQFIDVPPQGFYPTEIPPTATRVEANQPCPQSGYWYTPAKAHSRAYFNKADLMPDYPASSYGATIWYWDMNQGGH